MIEIMIAGALQQALKELYNIDYSVSLNLVQKTRKEYEGDFTIVVFPFAKMSRKAPDITAREIGEWITQKLSPNGISGYNVVNGFLNLSFSVDFWLSFLNDNRAEVEYGFSKNKSNEITLIEYSSPNTNKPLHLGHVRNNLLGSSVAKILNACGKKVVKVNLVNDRGIHICKSMLAWQKFGNGETPESSGLKGDHLVGKYYVEFDLQCKREIAQLIAEGVSEEEAAKKAPLILEAQEMLRRWENGDEEVRALWNKMNGWVYKGFEDTYNRLGVSFDKTYYESQTYLLGKKLVEEGVLAGAFYKKEDGSVWVDLTSEGLDEKLLLRSDGTSVYMTQDLGTAQLRFDQYQPEKMIYVVGNEQNYHFDVLKLVLAKKLKREFADNIFHLSYGMVELPFGKMKSREGTVVDADDLMEEMFVQAKESTEQLGKSDFAGSEADRLYEMIGLGALKYFILKVDPKKNMLFNPADSIDFNGNTAPFIQYTHARIKSLLRKAVDSNIDLTGNYSHPELLGKNEKELVKLLYDFPQIVLAAGETLSPALIANYLFDLAQHFNTFYQETPIFKEENVELRKMRLGISGFISIVIKNGMSLLGIEVPDKM